MSNETDTQTRVPDPERLQAAIDLIVARLEPDQIILFGSAAREEMSELSDLDLLVIKERGPHAPEHEHWECRQTGDELDVILMNRTTAEQGRRSAAYIQGAALEEGRTIYARAGITPIPTGPTYTWNGEKMVKSTLFEPDHANELLDQAERRWDLARYAPHPADKCEMLQASMERAFKALITAQGRRVKHTHNLNALWAEAEIQGERIDVSRNPEELDKLSKYAGDWQYAIQEGADPAASWIKTSTTGADLLNHARRRVPQLVQDTMDRLRAITEPPPSDQNTEGNPHAKRPKSMPAIVPGGGPDSPTGAIPPARAGSTSGPPHLNPAKPRGR